MTAGEAGADYVMFGEPHGGAPAMALRPLIERVGWWAEIFETPCVAFADSIEAAGELAHAGADFVALDDAIWSAAAPAEAAREAHGLLAHFAAKYAMTRRSLAWAAAVALAFPAFDAASAQAPAPNVASPLLNLSGFASPQAPLTPLPPRADGKPPDLAFGAYQRGNFLAALKEAERRIDDNSKDAAAMTLIGQIYHDGAALGRNDLEASHWWRTGQRSWRSAGRL